MRPVLRMTDRLITFVVAVVLLTGAGWIIGYGLDSAFARQAAARIDVAALGRAPEWPWWSAALGIGGVIAILIGGWLVLLHLRPRSVRAVDTEHAGAVDLTRIADAAAGDIGRHPGVQSAKASTRIAGGSPTVRITVGVAPTTSEAQLRRFARHCADDVRRAADADVEFQLLVHPVSADKVRPRVT